MTGAGSRLYFRGALALPDDDAEPTLVVDLRFADDVVIITQGDEEIGVWSVEDVDAERLNGQKFLLHLGDDEVIFQARDRAGFAYTGINALNAAKERVARQRNKWRFGRAVTSDTPTAPTITWSKLVERSKTLLSGLGPWHGRGSTGAADVDVVRATRSWSITTPVRRSPPDGGRPRLSAGRDVETEHDESPIDPIGATPPHDPWGSLPEEMLRRDDDLARRATPKPEAPPEHAHSFSEKKLPGGLVRRTCECGEVVIRGGD